MKGKCPKCGYKTNAYGWCSICEVYCRVRIFALALLLSAGTVWAHVHNGVDYRGWMRPDMPPGHSCCNDNDCHPATARHVNGHWEVFIENQWILVPEAKIIYNLPEQPISPHVCHIGLNIFCFAVGGGI